MTDGTEGKPWFDGANTEQTEYITTKGWKGPLDVVESARNADKLIGAHSAGRTVVLPKDDKDVEGIAAFRAKIGVPEKPEEYGTPESLKEDPLWPTVAQAAHKHGIPKASLNAFVEDVMKASGEHRTQNQAKVEGEIRTHLEALKGEWGDKFDANTELAKRAMKQFATDSKLPADQLDGLMEAVDKSPHVRRLFAHIAQSLGEDKFSAGDTTPAGGDSRSAVQDKLDALRKERIEGKLTQMEWDEKTAPLYAELNRAA